MLVGRTRLARELAALGLRPGAVALVHCRMSTLGTVVGGAETVVRALLEAVGPDGTLVAYLGWEGAPPDDLDALASADRKLVLAEQPVYDPATRRARRDHGRMAEALRTWPGAVHSGHPEAGVAAVDREAAALALPHPLDDAYGAGTPYARVVERGGQVVLLGAARNRHARPPRGGDRACRRQATHCVAVPRARRRPASVEDAARHRHECGGERLTGGVDYVEYFARVALERDAGRSGQLGAGTGHVLGTHRLTECTVQLIESAFPARGAAD